MKSNDKDQDDKRSKRDERRSYSSDDDEDDRRSNKDKKKKERVKLITKDKNLLLSFVYFDHTHCGYIFDKDVEDLIYTLGLNFSRSQVKKLVSKAVTRDSLLYRKLTDKPKEEEKEEQDTVGESSLDWHELACGNRKLLPVFESGGKCLNETIGEIDPDKKPIPTDGNMS